MIKQALPESVLYCVGILVVLSTPGLLLLRWPRFVSEFRADLLLAMVACSLANRRLLGLLLGYVGWYSKAALIVALVVHMLGTSSSSRPKAKFTDPVTSPV